MSSISYFSGLHILTTDEFENLIQKDPQGLYCIVDAPVSLHNFKHYKNGADPLFAADIGALPDSSPVHINCPPGNPFIFKLTGPSSIEGEIFAFYDGVNAKYNNSAVPVVLIAGQNMKAMTTSPILFGDTGLRNIMISNSAPDSATGQNGDICIVHGQGVYTKMSDAWQISATAILTEFMPKAGGTFTGPVTFGMNASSIGGLNITSTYKAAGYFYGGTVNPTNSTRLNYDGYLYATRIYNAYMADYAEVYSIGCEYEPGMVVTLDPFEKEFDVNLCYMECDENVLGIISNEYAFCIGGEPDEEHAPIALAGRVPVFVDGECQKGNYLITSGKRGYAKAVKNLNNIPRGCVIGRALSDKNEETGMAICFINRM